MANHKSAQKSIRQNEKRTLVNRSRESRVKTFIKKLETLIEAKDYNNALVFLREAQSEIMKGVTAGVFKQNTAARKVSNLAQRVKKIAS